MAACLAIATRLLGLVSELLGIANLIRQLIEHVAQEHSPYQIEGIVTTSGITIAHPTYGLAAIKTAIDALPGGGGPTIQDVLDAIAALPAGSALPATFIEPVDVWNYMPLNATPGTVTADQLLTWAGQYAGQVGTSKYVRLPLAPDFALSYSWAETWALVGVYGWEPSPDYADILAGDTALSWLNRTDTVYGGTWLYDANIGLCYTTTFGSSPHPDRVICLLHDWQLGITTAAIAAPVWPGLAAVTLGSPVALSPDLELAGPMDGVLLTITTPPSGLGKFEIAARTWWYRLGQIAFVSDNGEVEPWQYLAWDQSVYCPRQMIQADAALIRCLAGAEGTATPWTVT